jgi:hypothetical protein
VVHTVFEEMRQENQAEGRQYEEQLARERIGEAHTMLEMLGKFYSKASVNEADMWDVLGVQGFFALHQYWRELGGPGGGDIALYSYMNSPYYYELPVIDVGARLYADLMVNGQRIKSGDNQDVQHLAFAIPIAHYVVTDSAMADRCRRRKVGERWGTKIYSSATLEALFEELGKL